MLPFFPQKVKNVTVTIGQDAVLRCKVDNLNNYKVRMGRGNVRAADTFGDPDLRGMVGPRTYAGCERVRKKL